jgi:hypothetical protein
MKYSRSVFDTVVLFVLYILPLCAKALAYHHAQIPFSDASVTTNLAFFLLHANKLALNYPCNDVAWRDNLLLSDKPTQAMWARSEPGHLTPVSICSLSTLNERRWFVELKIEAKCRA